MQQLFRGRILHCPTSWNGSAADCVEYIPDGVLAIEEDKIVACDSAENLQRQGMDLSKARELKSQLIIPGMIDIHVHSPQLEIIGAYGEQLLEWLQRYTLPAELKFSDAKFAKEISYQFLRELIDNGTTTAAVYPTSHEASVDALFDEAEKMQLCLIAGKVLMDRNAPEDLLDGEDLGMQASHKLIEKWHGKSRFHYAVTPRFSITSSAEQLKMAGELLHQYDDLYVQTHLSENTEEIAKVLELFPQADSYLDTYQQAGLVTDRSIFAHGIHLQQQEIDSLAANDACIAFCPSSNMFLGSGLLDIDKLEQNKVKYGVATDVGAGTSLSMFRTLGDAYKVCQLQGIKLEPLKAFYMATRGNATALKLEKEIGSLKAGSIADFLILDPCSTALMQRRIELCSSIEEEWFVYMTLGDERLVEETWVAGKPVHSHRKNQPNHWLEVA